MTRKRILTRNVGISLNVLFEDGRPVQMEAEPFEEASILNCIYMGRIQNIVKNIGAVFVEYAPGKTAYLEQRQVPEARIGQELLIQITAEAARNKQPRCTTHFTIGGRFAVLTVQDARILISSKISNGELRKHLKETFSEYVTPAYGYILRTECAEAAEEEIREELLLLRQQYEQVCKGQHRNPFSLVYQPEQSWIAEIRSRDLRTATEIITDQADLYQQLVTCFGNASENLSIRFYDDAQVSLYRLYQMEKWVTEATSERVWMRSGGFLIIQPTEAMVVIDVNSGKAIAGKKAVADTLLTVNLEAAEEVARQIRLRNLSGIIVIDFIDMPEDYERRLTAQFSAMLKKDPVPCEFVEMTKLNFAVMTRKKIRRPFTEQLRNAQKKMQNHEKKS